MTNLLLIIVGQLRIFNKRQSNLNDFIFKLEQQGFNIDIIVSTSELHIDLSFWKYNSKVRHIIYLNHHMKEYNRSCLSIQRSNIYQNYYNKLHKNNTVPSQDQKNPLCWYSQWFQFKKALEIVPYIENSLNYQFNLIIKTRFDYCYPDDINLNIFTMKNPSYIDILTGNNITYQKNLYKSMKEFNLTTNDEYKNFVKNIKINPNAGRIYNDDLCNLNFGGRYFLNYETISKNNLDISNIIYFYNDWFFYGLRDVMMKYINICNTYLQIPIKTNDINFYFTPEFQVLLYAKNNNIDPIMFFNENIGGIDREDAPFVLNDRYYVNGIKYLYNGINLVRNNSEYNIQRIENAIKPQYVSLLCNYVKYGDVVKIILDISISSNAYLRFNDQFCQIVPTQKEYSFICNSKGKFYIHIDLLNIELNSSVIIYKFEYKIIENNIKVITFYSQGLSIDGVESLDLTECENIYRENIEHYIDSYQSYSYNDVKKLNPIMIKNFDIDSKANMGSGYTGFFRWKPFIILEELKKVRYGDIILYRDCNIKKYPNYLIGLDSIKETIGFIFQQTNEDIYIPIENETYKNYNYIKQEVFDYFKLDTTEYKNYPLLNASMILLRKSKKSIKLIREWLNLCMNDDLIDGTLRLEQDKLFRHNTFDQAILNLLVRKKINNGELSVDFPRFMNRDRIFDKEQLIIYPNSPYLDKICSNMTYFGKEYNLIKLDNNIFITLYSENIEIDFILHESGKYNIELCCKFPDDISGDIKLFTNNISNIIGNYEIIPNKLVIISNTIITHSKDGIVGIILSVNKKCEMIINNTNIKLEELYVNNNLNQMNQMNQMKRILGNRSYRYFR
jgi:hypothetical protein